MNIISPLNKRIIVEPEAQGAETKTAGGIVIPEKAKQNNKAPTKGTVISISPDSDMKHILSPGDIVIFPSFSGTEIIVPAKVAGQKDRALQIMKEESILAVIRTASE